MSDTTINLQLPGHSAQTQRSAQRQRAGDIAAWLGQGRSSIRAKPRAARGTLAWFFKHTIYTSWLETPAAATVLQGAVGSGKTTLVHTISQRLIDSSAKSGARVLAFYCGYLDGGTPCIEQLLRTILIDIATSSSIPTPLLRLYEGHNAYLMPRQPSVDDLEETVIEVFRAADTAVFLLVDALDEVTDADRPDVIDFLNRVVNESIDNLHVLLINRAGSFLRRLQSNRRWTFETVPRHEVRGDIARFVNDDMEKRDNLEVLDAESKDIILQRLVRNDNDQ